jgi:hypothetical protein|tara:strand:+ start:167 stop:520 length:354 start_codon:yes stop_codon:yes gene_type:complete
MSSDNCLHSFTISPESSAHIATIRNKKKSQFVSEAIIHYRNWRHTDHTQLKITEYPGVKDVKDINLALEEKEMLLQRWVKRTHELQELVIQLENRLSLLQENGKKVNWFRKLWHFFQ